MLQNGESPLHFGARQGHLDIVNLLLEDNADLSIRNVKGENVLHIAVKECHHVIVKRIIEYTISKFNNKKACDLINQLNTVSLDETNHLKPHPILVPSQQSGESCVHYAANLTVAGCHYENEDRDIMRLLVETGGNTFLETLEVRIRL